MKKTIKMTKLGISRHDDDDDGGDGDDDEYIYKETNRIYK